VFIATVDDDMHRDQGYIILYQLLKHYVMGGSGNRIVALRARRIGVCRELPYKITRYYSWPVQLVYNREEMLLMPTGTGGILYKPSYFHKVIFHKSLRFATGTADDLMFRLATLANSVPVELGCSVMRYRARVVRSCEVDDLDRKYDSVYGTESTEFFKKLIAETTAKMTADVAALEAPAQAENEHDNSGVADAQQEHSSNASTAVTRDARRLRRLRGAAVGVETEGNSDNGENGKAVWRIPAPHGHQADSPCGIDEDLASDVVGSTGGDDVTDLDEDVEGSADEASRRLRAKRIKYRGVTRNGTESDLFSINRRGGNDVSWKVAVEVLKSMRVMDIEKIVTEFINERESYCYLRKGRTVRMERYCALFQCGKPFNITIGNATVSHAFQPNERRQLARSKDETSSADSAHKVQYAEV
jgi:hypothetical protein